MKMIATLVAAFSLALAGAALAADTTTGTTGSTSTTASTPAPEASPAASPVAKTSTKPAAAKSVSGSFVKADSTANTVTLKVGAKEMTYNVSSDTKVTKGGKDITWADLKEGDRVSGKAQGDKLTMLSVKGAAVKSKTTASPAPSPAAAK